MIVRDATQADIPRIVEMAREFYAISGYRDIAEASIPSLAGLAIITMESGVMLVADDGGDVVGMACLYIEPYVFNPEVTIANEIAWWIEPSHRGTLLAMKMMTAIHARCAEKEVKAIRMAVLKDSPPAAVGVYERLGYVKTDSHYMRVI